MGELPAASSNSFSAASSEELRTAFEDHLQQTEQQVSRLEQAMGVLDVPVKGKKCMGMQGIIEEGKRSQVPLPLGGLHPSPALSAALPPLGHALSPYASGYRWKSRY